jgi:hypothetical protein
MKQQGQYPSVREGIEDWLDILEDALLMWVLARFLEL